MTGQASPHAPSSVVIGRGRAWLHIPQAGSPAGRAPVLFLGPHGAEDLCARRSLFDLADRMARTGHLVMRLDLPGTGDSLGTLQDTELWNEWVNCTLESLALLQSRAPGNGLCLLGMRLGALVGLAAQQQAAARGLDLTQLVLLAPVLNGRQHVRELRTLSAPDADGLEVAGFQWGTDLQQALNGQDAASWAPAPGVVRAFVGLAHSNKAWTQWSASWASAVELTVQPYGDLQQHIGDQVFSQTPEALWHAAVRWVNQGSPAPDKPATPPHSPDTMPSQVLKGSLFTETAVTIGEATPMTAIFCESTRPDRCSGQPVVVFCNTGRNPHTGWARSWVELARLLAVQGYDSLRYDLPGIGDSPPLPQPPDELLYSNQQFPLLQSVTDDLSRRLPEGTPLIMVGMCSGGFLAYHHAVADRRIRHVILVNVQKFVWVPGTSLAIAWRTLTTRPAQNYIRLAMQWQTWRRFLSGQVNWRPIVQKLWSVLSRRIGHRVQALIRAFTRRFRPESEWNPHDRIPLGFQRLSQRGTGVSVLYSEDDAGRDEFALYFGPASTGFTQLAGARLTLIPNADHELTSAESRRVMYDEVLLACNTVAGRIQN